MRVQLSVEAISPVLTGIGRYVWELASRLPNASGVDGLALHRGGRWLGAIEDCFLEYKGSRPRWPRWVRRAQANWYAGHREWRMQNSVFHGPNYFLPDRIDAGVITVHDLSVFRYPEMHPSDRVLDFEQRFASSLARATHVITDTEAVRLELLKDWGLKPANVTAVHLAADGSYHPRAAATTKQVLKTHDLKHGAYTLCVATLEPRKKIDVLINAYEALPHALRREYPLVLVGHSGWHSEALLDQIRKGQEQGWLKYLGYVKQADLPLLYAGARLFVYLSVYEGFGLPLVEALSSGIPVLASDQSCLPEVCAGAALHVNPNDEAAVTTALAKALEDLTWRGAARSDGLTIASSYSWNKCVTETVSVYQRALETH